MKIPRIRLSFDYFEKETEKAFLLKIGQALHWIPKSICSNLTLTKGMSGWLNIAPFKWQEVTGVIPAPLDSFAITNVAPIESLPEYDIIEPMGFMLRENQLPKVLQVYRVPKFFVYGQMRTGKTVIAATIANSRLLAGLIETVVVIAPLRTESVWKAHLNGFQFIATEHFSNIHTRYGISLDCNSRTMVILDESHQIKNHSAARVSEIIEKTANAGHKIILSGTPIGKHAGDLYHQFEFLDPSILNYHSYDAFAASHLLYGGREGKTVVAYTNIEEISAKVSPYTMTMTRAEMGIDREKVYSVIGYSASNQDKYDALKAKYQKQYERGNGAGILGFTVKLQQCANGYTINDEDECTGYADNGRAECLGDILATNSGKSIVVYFKYDNDIEALKAYDMPILNGKTNRNEFDRIISEFNAGNVKVIGLQQQLSIGFSLKACDVMIYYSRKFGSIGSAQSEDRACESVGKPLQIIDIAAENTIDYEIKAVISRQFDIINLFKSEIRK